MKSYSEKLRHPKWQKKRLEVFQRDEFRCQLCWNNQRTLHVHHKYYTRGRDPWQYHLKAFLTLCEVCHKKIHPKKEVYKPPEIPYQLTEGEMAKTDDARSRFFDMYRNNEIKT